MGVGFFDTNSNDEWFINYDVNPYVDQELENMTFPNISYNETTNLYIVKWPKYVRIVVEDEVLTSKCHWERQELVGYATGEQINTMIKTYAREWDQNWTETYQPMQLRYRDNGELYNNLRSKQCQDFAFGAINFL